MELFNSIFIACVLVFPVHIFTLIVLSSKTRRERYKQQAIARGHVVTAQLKKRSYRRDDIPGTQTPYSYKCVYEYTYNGKKYKRVVWDEDPQVTITLYFLKNPRKASRSGDLGATKIQWFWIYGIVAGLVYFVMNT